MMTNFLEIQDHRIALDKEGYLKDIQDWNEEIATALALLEQIRLSTSHWKILNLLRAFYKRHQMSPANRALSGLVKRKLGKDKGRSVYLMKLFSGSPAKMACKIAGLPKPDNCI